MPKGYSVHVGVNRAQSSFQMPTLKGCTNDAKAMRDIAVDRHFEPQGVFLDEEATFKRVREAIVKAATDLGAGDIFLFTFSGHGSQNSASLSATEPDGKDETILLHDCVLLDNYIRRVLWSKFDKGVRILGVADCCHSGSAIFAFNFGDLHSETSFFSSAVTSSTASFSSANGILALEPAIEINAGTGRAVKGFTADDLDNITKKTDPEIPNRIRTELATEGKEPQATLLTLAACADNEKALDAETESERSAFTQAMWEVLPAVLASDPPENYDDLMTRIGANLAIKEITTQHPTRYPQPNPDLGFLRQAPFTIFPP